MSENPVTVDSAFVEALLDLPTVADQTAHLQAADLLNAAGLSQLVDQAGLLVRRDLSRAQQLTAVCLDIAETAHIPSVVPRTAYLKAQTHALSGDLESALQLVQAAHSAYLANGQEQQALATNVGLMHILAELGQYQQALAAGQAILDGAGDNPPAEYMTMAAQAAHNMGLCHRRLGQYEAALQDYSRAESYYQMLGLPERIGDISNNRGVLLMEIGRAGEALTALQAALALRTAAGQLFLQAQTMTNLGSVQLLLGNYSQSLAMFEQARQLFASQEESLDRLILLLDTAHAYLALNLYAEATEVYREVEGALAAAGAGHHHALALWGLGAALLAQGSLDEAEQVLGRAVNQLQTPATPLLATVLLEQAAVQTAHGQTEAALDSAQEALQLATDNSWPLPALYADLRLCDLYADNPPQAEQHLLAAQPLVESIGLPHLNFRWLERYGRLRRRQGQDVEAQQLLEAAIHEIERLRGNLAQEAFRPSFLRDKMMAYDELVHLFLDRGDLPSLQRAFAVTEQAKSRALVDLMSGVVNAQVTAVSEQAQQLQQLQSNLNALYNEMLTTGTEGERRVHIADIQVQAAQVERQIAQRQLRAAATGLVSDSLTTSISPEPLLAQIPPDITLLSYYCLDDELMAFVSRDGEMTVRRRLCRVSDVRKLLERLNVHWGRFRVGREFVSQHLPMLNRAAEQLLGRLYDLVLGPIESLLAGVTELTIVPHGPLHHLPFPALFDGQDYVVERFEISYAPSTTVFLLCRNRRPHPSYRTLVLGVPDPSIPAVRQEVAAVARYASEAEVFLDTEATLGVLETNAAAGANLHLACHGVFRADNPMFSAIRLHDGWLTAVQALQLNLNGALVTLSGCDTGMNQIINGDELLGLTRAFLGAGAASLIVSLWLAQDETTAALMSTLYEQLRDGRVSRAAALRQAQRAIKAAHTHPFYWAPFILVGQREFPTNN